MVAKESSGRGGTSGADYLIPGLPEEIVLGHVVTRLPWYARPVCRAISKSWKASIDTSTKRPELQLKSRKNQLPLLEGCIVLCTFDTRIFITKGCMPLAELKGAGFDRIQWENETYQIHKQWRKLPPLQGLLPPPPNHVTLLANSGMVYVWSNGKPDNFVFKMDLGSGDWIWNKVHITHPFNKDAVHFNGKIYVPQVSTGQSANHEKQMVLVHDMMTDKCEQVKAWNRDNLRVLHKKGLCASLCGEDEMYSFIEDESLPEPVLELLVYDAGRDSWRTKENIPIPECRWSELPELKLVNGDCFEPAPDVGINTVWVDSEGEVLSWFNSSLPEPWVEFNYNVSSGNKYLEYIDFICGSLFGIFIEEEEEEEEEEEKDRGDQEPHLCKRTLMKGTMCVSSNAVKWEEVVDVGCFRGAYSFTPSVVSPINHYTLMA
ncbi:hypothetical protein L7F22_053687 [Adiantum nelumboides]|nr:hypothetical protein [Adiantum nelumboides]